MRHDRAHSRRVHALGDRCEHLLQTRQRLAVHTELPPGVEVPVARLEAVQAALGRAVTDPRLIDAEHLGDVGAGEGVLQRLQVRLDRAALDPPLGGGLLGRLHALLGHRTARDEEGPLRLGERLVCGVRLREGGAHLLQDRHQQIEIDGGRGRQVTELGELRPELDGEIRTTIDQTAWTDEVFSMKRGKMELVASGTHSLLSADGTPLWLVQKGKFAYRILPEYTREAFVTCETRPTDWVKRNKVNEKKQGLPSEARILRLWANHGQRPVDDTYGYVVYAGRQIPSDELPFRVLQNDTLVQAVCSMDGKVVEAVLYPGNKGLQAEGLSLSASAPCAVLIREEAGEIVVSVTDACMNAALKGIRIVLNGREIKVPMPQGMLCGKPAVIRVDRMTNQ